MRGLRGEVLDWFDSGRVVPGREQQALCAAALAPTPSDWRLFLGRLTLWLGTIALASSVIFFFAFNWAALGRFAKFGLVEGVIVAALLACWRLDLDEPPGKAVLLLLSLLAGALLALTGQVYQTGADTFELFAWWALLILPWVLVGRFSPLWLVWLGLIDVALFLYFQIAFDLEALLWSLFALNGVALIGWEAAHRSGLAWLRDEWPPRLVAIVSGMMATALMIWAIVGDEGRGALAALAYFAWLAAFYYWYRRVRPDLFMLAVGLLSVIVTAATFLAEQLLGGPASAGYLVIGLVVIGLSAAGALWLKSVGREQLG